MDTLASNLGSMVRGLLDMAGAGMPSWYGTLLDNYCYDAVQLGYYFMAVGFFMIASCARVLHRHKARTYFELFPRSGGDVCKLCEALSTTMSHYDKNGRRP